jgi:hypothetical protein
MMWSFLRHTPLFPKVATGPAPSSTGWHFPSPKELRSRVSRRGYHRGAEHGNFRR